MMTLIGSAPNLERFFDDTGVCVDREGAFEAVARAKAIMARQDEIARRYCWQIGNDGFYTYEAVR